MPRDLTTDQQFALSDELYTAAALARYGLAAVQAISGRNEDIHLPALLLSSAFERLAKCTLLLRSIETETPAPDPKRYGHKLELLVDHVVNQCFDDPYSAKSPGREDRAFLASDPRFREILGFFADFAVGGRYHELNIASVNPFDAGPSPVEKWYDLHWRVMREEGVKSEVVRAGDDERQAYAVGNRAIVATLEQALRAHARLYTYGPLGDLGSQFSGPLRRFLMRKDEQFGHTEYREGALR